jgi:hypothetical protein
MYTIAPYIVWLFLLPFRLVSLSFALIAIIVLVITALGNAYVTTIIKNIVSNFFSFRRFNLDKERQKHTDILGATGCGKSSAIECFIDQNIQKQQGFLLIEPHGELVHRILRNKRFALTHRSQSYKKLLFLDFDEAPPQLNIFKLSLPKDANRKLAFIGGLSADLADAFSLNMQPAPSEAQIIMLRNIIMAGFYIDNVKFGDLISILQPQTISAQLLNQVIQNMPLPPLKNYFQTDFFSSNTRKTKEA